MSASQDRPEMQALGLQTEAGNIPLPSVKGKTAFVTGAASGIGCATAAALLEKGAKVMLADYDKEGLAQTQRAFNNHGDRVGTVVCDVASPEAVEKAAQATVDQFEKVHIIFNNAGVSLGGETGAIPLQDWRWIMDINLMGVVHGQEIFTPLIKAHGEGGQIVNTASMAGHFALPQLTPYTATKYAVVGMSEGLRSELAPHNIGVSVLCPGWVNTKIHEAGKKRPSAFELEAEAEGEAELTAIFSEFVTSGIDAALVGDWVVQSIEANRAYIFTQPDMRPGLQLKYAAIEEDYQACDDHFLKLDEKSKI